MSTDRRATVERCERARAGLKAALAEMGDALSAFLEDGTQDAMVSRRTQANGRRLSEMFQEHLRRIQEGLQDRPEEAVIIEQERQGGNRPCLPEPDMQYLDMVRQALGPKFRVWVYRQKTLWGREWVMCARLLSWPKEHRSAVAHFRRRSA